MGERMRARTSYSRGVPSLSSLRLGKPRDRSRGLLSECQVSGAHFETLFRDPGPPVKVKRGGVRRDHLGLSMPSTGSWGSIPVCPVKAPSGPSTVAAVIAQTGYSGHYAKFAA